MIDIEDAWENYIEDGEIKENMLNLNVLENKAPKGSDIYISTKTKIVYLNYPIDLNEVFWKIKLINYYDHKCGIVKKQMKFNFIDKNHLNIIEKKLLNEKNVEQHIINQIDNPEGRIKFKDIRKISIGICNKDIISYRQKKKSAFYNCFVVILRVLFEDKFKEIHIKVFNTGKLEIPGIRCQDLFDKVIDLLLKILRDITNNQKLNCDQSTSETVLINSNFNCGFYINIAALLKILKYEYQLNCTYDACQYPGIQCKYNYQNTKNNYKISFMIFRTGSVLIVGKCDENVLYEVYNYIKDILTREYSKIFVRNTEINKLQPITKRKLKKIYIEKS